MSMTRNQKGSESGLKSLGPKNEVRVESKTVTKIRFLPMVLDLSTMPLRLAVQLVVVLIHAVGSCVATSGISKPDVSYLEESEGAAAEVIPGSVESVVIGVIG
jgi:hypothetical protein